MKRDVLATLMITIGVLLCGTLPGIAIGAPMTVLGAFWLVEPRLQSKGLPNPLRRLGRLG